MQEELAALDINDIAPIIGNLQLNAIQQDKTIRALRQRIMELEFRLNGEGGPGTEVNIVNGAADTSAIPLEASQ